MPNGTKWAFAQFKKKADVKRARKKAWKMMGGSNVYAKPKQVKVSKHLGTRLPKMGNSSSEMILRKEGPCNSKFKHHLIDNLGTNSRIPISKRHSDKHWALVVTKLKDQKSIATMQRN